jgi:arginase
MMARFLVVPQWQGSASSRAMAHIDGAEAISGDLPRSSCTSVDVPLEAGESLATGVLRLSALRRVREGVLAALADPGSAQADRFVLIGGDAGVAVWGAEHLAGDDLAVVWLDAHGDLRAPSTDEPAALEAMALRTVIGEGEPSLSTGPVPPSHVVLAGVRSLDEEESGFLDGSGIRVLTVDDLSPQALVDAVRATGCARVFVHLALDVLDPAHITGVIRPEPFGPEPAAVVAAVTALREEFSLAGAALTGFAPSSPAAAIDDMGVILRLIGALVR